MKTKIIQIGNSKGLRLSKTLIEKYQIGDMVNLRLEDERIIIEPLKNPRANWDQAFAKMNTAGDDTLLMNDVFADEEWPEWK